MLNLRIIHTRRKIEVALAVVAEGNFVNFIGWSKENFIHAVSSYLHLC